MISIAFLPGLFGQAQDFAPVANALASLHTILLETPVPNATSVDPWREAVVALGHQLPPRPVHLVGYSMGGRLALALAAAFPQRVSQITVVSANPGLDDANERKERALLDAERAASLREAPKAFLKQWYQAPLFSSFYEHVSFDEVFERRCTLLNASVQLQKHANAIELFSPGRVPSLWMGLGALKVPTTFVVGALDAKYKAMTAKLPTEVGVEVVEGAGHALHLEASEVLAAMLHRLHSSVYPAQSPSRAQSPAHSSVHALAGAGLTEPSHCTPSPDSEDTHD